MPAEVALTSVAHDLQAQRQGKYVGWQRERHKLLAQVGVLLDQLGPREEGAVLDADVVAAQESQVLERALAGQAWNPAQASGAEQGTQRDLAQRRYRCTLGKAHLFPEEGGALGVL